MKRAACKAKAACTSPDSVEHVCPHCSILFHAQIVLVSHLCSHQTWMIYDVVVFFLLDGQIWWYMTSNTTNVEPFVHDYFCHGKGLLIWGNECMPKHGNVSVRTNTSHLTDFWMVYFCIIYMQHIQSVVGYYRAWLCFGTCVMTLFYFTTLTVANIICYIPVHHIPLVFLVQGYDLFHTLMTFTNI